MPFYQYECSACSMQFELFETMTEHKELDTPHCPQCDPEGDNETTMFVFMGNVRPAFQVKGDGAYDNRMKT
jgi:putative FmdB family regulatory protein